MVVSSLTYQLYSYLCKAFRSGGVTLIISGSFEDSARLIPREAIGSPGGYRGGRP